jgi:imidazoleglycerol-phosphate dehydratase
MPTKARKAKIVRKTKETQITLELNLDGSGNCSIQTPLGFMNHMLQALAKHALLDLKVQARGDVEIDAHHTVEDLGLVLGEALSKALGDKKGISRFGEATVPMDEALALAAVDLSGRPFLEYQAEIPERQRWEFDVNLIAEFLRAFTTTAKITLHLRLLAGSNYHHCVEAIFKALARALRQAVALDPRQKGVPSSKGRLA